MQAGPCAEGIQPCWGIEGLLILGLLSLELPFQLIKPIYPKNCQLKIRQVQWERGGREGVGWTRVILPMAGASALCGPVVRAGNLQKLKRGSWAGLLGGGFGLDLSVWRWFPLFISVAWGCRAICDILYRRQEGQGDRGVAAGNLVRTRTTCRHWLSMQWVHLLRDSCSIRIISVQLYLLYLTLVLELGCLGVLQST